MARVDWFDPNAPSRQVSRQRQRLAHKDRTDAPPRRREWIFRHTTTRFYGPGERDRRWAGRSLS